MSMLRIAAAGVALATFGYTSAASAATTATANARAEILSTLAVTIDGTDDTLDFGQISPLPAMVANTTVVVTPANSRTCGTNITCGGTTRVPLFHVTGLAGSQVTITVPTTTVQLTNSGTIPTGMSAVMDLTALTTDAASNQVTLAGTGAGGTAPFKVGGTLTVKPTQAPGVYTGTFNVSVQYN